MIRRNAACLPLFVALVACGAPQGQHVRFARASASEIDAARESGQLVWYDFEAGDEVPMSLGLLGVAEAITEQPVRMVAQRPFSILIYPDGRTAFSFDGSAVVSGQTSARWSIALGSDENGGRAALVLFLGPHQLIRQMLEGE